MTDNSDMTKTLTGLYKLQRELEYTAPRPTESMRYALDDAITLLLEYQVVVTDKNVG